MEAPRARACDARTNKHARAGTRWRAAQLALGKGDKFVNTIIRAGGADVLDLDAEGGGNAWWWLVFDGREFGPLSTSAVTQLCLSGVVRPDTPVRSNRFAQH